MYNKKEDNIKRTVMKSIRFTREEYTTLQKFKKDTGIDKDSDAIRFMLAIVSSMYSGK